MADVLDAVDNFRAEAKKSKPKLATRSELREIFKLHTVAPKKPNANTFHNCKTETDEVAATSAFLDENLD